MHKHLKSMSLQNPKFIPSSSLDSMLHDKFNSKRSELPVCVRCKKPIISEHAYELGDDKWHTHCFTCSRCKKHLSRDSDFLVLGTGELICFDCSKSCKRCGRKIDDLAIILSSSNEAYCSDCFVCYKCRENIKDLMYAKTKKGLFCLKCHQKSLAKRKHFEEKKRREMKRLPLLPEPLKEKSFSSTRREFDSISYIPQILEGSSSVSKYSSIRETSMSSSLHEKIKNNNSISADAPKEKVLSSKLKGFLNKTPLKNYEKRSDITDKDRNTCINSLFNNKHRKELSLPILDSRQTLDISPIKQVIKIDVKSKGHLKSHSDFSRSITKSTFQGGNDIYQEHTNVRTPQASLNIYMEAETSSTFNDFVEQRALNPKILTTQGGYIDEKGIENKSYYPNSNNTPDYNSTMSHVNDVSSNDRKKISSPSEKRPLNLSELLEDNSTNSEVKKKITVLNQLEEDINKCQTTKGKLLPNMEDTKVSKKNLENKLNSLKKKIKSVQNTLREYTQLPRLFTGLLAPFSDECASKKNESTVSVSKSTNKPKIWRIFPSRTQNTSSMMSSPISYSRSNQNTSHIRNIPNPTMLNTPNSKLGLADTAIEQKKQKNKISQPTLQHSEDPRGVNLIPISNYDNEILFLVLNKCIQYIESNEENLKTKGLYRKSGSKKVIEEIEVQFKNGKNIDLSLYDINAITGVLKKRLRDSPNPIITYEIYKPIIDYVRQNHTELNNKTFLQDFTQILKSLPKENIEVLKLLGKHINLVQKYSEFNLMTAKNLYVVFTPTLMRDYSGERDIIDLKERHFVIGYILEHYQELFS